jgi:hypothetical protein
VPKVRLHATRLFAALVILPVACGIALGCGGERQQLASKPGVVGPADGSAGPSATSPTGGSGAPAAGTGAPSAPSSPRFSPTSFWNVPIPAGATLDPSSAAIVGAFVTEVAAEEAASRGPWINIKGYSVPIYTVPASQATVSVKVANHPRAYSLQAAWDAVPLPPTAQPAPGGDAELVVWQPSTNRLWEFWKLVHGSSGWEATWGGAMQDVSTDPGVYTTAAWPGAKTFWGASASSLSIAGGLITLEDLERGQINHALAMAVPNVRGAVYASPAQRTDGSSTNPFSLPEGAHLRLDPNLDLATLHLPRLTLMMAEAAQRYGIYVRDGAKDVTSFFSQDPVTGATNPYAGPTGYLEGRYPNQILASFPWSHLQLLKMELHRRRPRRHGRTGR